MSRLQQEISNAMLQLTLLDKNNAHAWFLFPREFVGFQGHFVERPVLPGICKLHAAQLVVEAAQRKSFRLEEVSMAKFIAPVTCDEEIVVDCRWKNNSDGSLDVKASIKREEAKIAVLQLVLGNAD